MCTLKYGKREGSSLSTASFGQSNQVSTLKSERDGFCLNRRRDLVSQPFACFAEGVDHAQILECLCCGFDSPSLWACNVVMAGTCLGGRMRSTALRSVIVTELSPFMGRHCRLVRSCDDLPLYVGLSEGRIKKIWSSLENTCDLKRNRFRLEKCSGKL